MSRIGKKPISVPAGVKVQHDRAGRSVQVEGPKGKLAFIYRPEVSVEVEDDGRQISCTVPADQVEMGNAKAFWGTTRARIQNMIVGVTEGYTRKLEIVGVGWNAKLQGMNLTLSVGYCNPIVMPVPQGLTCTVEGQIVTISGHDKQLVGRFAADIRSKRKPEPYNGKGIKYVGEVIIRKQGKAFGS